MINLFKSFIRFIKYSTRQDSKTFVKKLIKKGFSIGNRTIFYDPETNIIDYQTPFLLRIGDDVQITKGVSFINHGYDWAVLKKLNGEMLGSRGPISIGNNVFIGINTVFLKNSSVGDNVIVGAASLVTKKFGSNVVIGGNPAKVLMSLEEYYLKRKQRQLEEAFDIFKFYFKKYSKIPKDKIFWEYFWIFSPRNKTIVSKHKNDFGLLNTYNESLHSFYNSMPIFDNYNSFVEFCLKKINEEK
jgi:acetyltransferase-like isoleucine patch superfamily enzyme